MSEVASTGVLSDYVAYYNHARPHHGIEQHCPVPVETTPRDGSNEGRDLLVGVLHDSYRRAA